MKKISNIIFYCCCFSLFLISCAKKENSSSSSTASAMSSPSIADGNYKMTAAIQKVYYSNGTLYGTFTYSISHDSSITPGYLAYVLEWKGSGVYSVTTKGKATLSASGSDDVTIDCTTNGITDTTLDTDGNVTNETAIQTGCGGSSSSLTEVSQKFTVISGGFQHYAVFEDSDSNQYQITYTFQKQATTSSSDDTSSFSVSEITQTNEGDGYLSGSFVVPSNGISFMLATFMDNNSGVAFYSLTDPDGTNILSSLGTLGGYGFAGVLVPQTPNFSAKAGTWTFKNYLSDRVKLSLRKGSIPSAATITVQPYITGTTWSANDIASALSVMLNIYNKNDITLSLKDTITISESQYATVSDNFTDSTTSALVSQGSKDTVNLFFVEDQPSSETALLGVSAGLPGTMGIASSWNGVINYLFAHAKETGSTLNSQLLGETAAHEMGHWLGLYHTSEYWGTSFDPISDTAECPISRDNDNDGKVYPEECEGYGADNLMFWTAWSTSSQAAGKKQESLSSEQRYILKYSPIAK